MQPEPRRSRAAGPGSSQHAHPPPARRALTASTPAAALQGCKDTFLDTLLSSAHMDMFMPGVDLVKRGDHVAELFIVVRGVVKVRGWAAVGACCWIVFKRDATVCAVVRTEASEASEVREAREAREVPVPGSTCSHTVQVAAGRRCRRSACSGPPSTCGSDARFGVPC